MKICHVITRMIIGGAQENTLFSAMGHVENGHDAVLATGPTAGPEGKLLETVDSSGLRVVEIPSLRREISPAQDLAAYRALTSWFRDEHFDVIHTHSSKAGVIGRIAAAAAGTPLIAHTVHGPSFHRYQSWWKNWLYIVCERIAARYSDRNYAVADAMVDLYAGSKIGKRATYKTVYSGMELSPYLNSHRDDKLAEELGLRPGAPVIGKIARLFEYKGYDYLLEAMPVITAAIPDVQFLIVGDGLLRREIEQQVETLGLQRNVVLSGLVSPEDIPRYVGLMDTLVHLSLREGLPRAVVQALAAAKPAVGFALDGTPEVILDGKTGFLCEPGDANAVATALLTLLQNPEQRHRMGAAGREHVREKWDWRYMVRTLEQDYETTLKKKKQQR